LKKEKKFLHNKLKTKIGSETSVLKIQAAFTNKVLFPIHATLHT